MGLAGDIRTLSVHGGLVVTFPESLVIRFPELYTLRCRSRNSESKHHPASHCLLRDLHEVQRCRCP
jgi:hypothetical protein